eukprot:1513-Eustigmatos_ZCMA.PRE.1
MPSRRTSASSGQVRMAADVSSRALVCPSATLRASECLASVAITSKPSSVNSRDELCLPSKAEST